MRNAYSTAAYSDDSSVLLFEGGDDAVITNDGPLTVDQGWEEHWDDEVYQPLLDSCAECVGCQSCRYIWSEMELLLWWRSGRRLPPLASTDILPSTIHFGGDTYGEEVRPGARVRVGMWIDDQARNAIEARYFHLGRSVASFDSNNLPAGTSVGIPFFDLNPAVLNENALPINVLLDASGQMRVESESEVLGGDAYIRSPFHLTPTSRADILFGYHASRVDEDLAVSYQTTLPLAATGVDIFDVRNEFHGVMLGFMMAAREGPHTIDLLAKLGIGDMAQQVRIQGASTLSPPPQAFNGSLFSLASNLGEYSRHKFAVVPEFSLKSRWQMSPCVEISFGYSFIYWSDIVQVGDTIDRSINSTQLSEGALTGQRGPTFRFRDGSYWAHGVNFGVSATY
ncbi:MAG: BBP7 family outer membrane beta-barrel protein [Pirellulaceae bacterium]|jgi:hypothetical protein|nr:BBP7 family outer membrane beta-barrel protein [Pirellulaceae bacterium]MDP7018381.1 BBP7 family outer membrane beta-barrel protein [Pirellulaceae bacterium]